MFFPYPGISKNDRLDQSFQLNAFFQKENPSDYEKAWNTFCHPQKEEKVQYF